MNTTQNYLSLDLELNNSEDGSTPNPKIIQVGVSVGSYEDYLNGELYKEKWYIDPQEPIFPFITELTGITDDDIVRNAVPHEHVAKELSALIKARDCFVNPITWGGGDSVELKEDFRARDIDFRCFGRRWIDVKTWYTFLRFAKGQPAKAGLKSAMHEFKLKFDGVPHRADDDALNTLRLFFKFLELQTEMNSVINMTKSIQ
jgi:inhibitor of KinA sporulation pathway (predicted exonuclease)